MKDLTILTQLKNQLRGDSQPFVDFIAELCEEKLLKMIRILEMENQE